MTDEYICTEEGCTNGIASESCDYCKAHAIDAHEREKPPQLDVGFAEKFDTRGQAMRYALILLDEIQQLLLDLLTAQTENMRLSDELKAVIQVAKKYEDGIQDLTDKLKDISTAAQPLINAWDDWLSDPMCDCEYEHVCGLNQRKAELAALQSLLKDK